jgi:hypothetical protein
MRKLALVNHIFGILAGAACASMAPFPAFAHEGHRMECSETGINAMNADIQAMPDGEAKKMARKEMQMAEEALAKHDMGGCETHMDDAMEAMEK